MCSFPGEQPADGSDPAEGGAFPAARPVAAGHAGAAGGADEQENGQCRFFSLFSLEFDFSLCFRSSNRRARARVGEQIATQVRARERGRGASCSLSSSFLDPLDPRRKRGRRRRRKRRMRKRRRKWWPARESSC